MLVGGRPTVERFQICELKALVLEKKRAIMMSIMLDSLEEDEEPVGLGWVSFTF